MSPRTIWLASYPRSGNTWVRALLRAVTEPAPGAEIDLAELGDGPIASSRGHLERWTGLTASELKPTEIDRIRPGADAALDASLDDIRFRKIHDALLSAPADRAIVPPAATLGAVYIVRDPRDVAVSLAHIYDRTQAQAVAAMANPCAALARSEKRLRYQLRQRLGTWSNHVSGWLDHELFPMLLVRYEDLAADTAGELTRIAKFAGLELSTDRVEAAIEVASFEQLRARESIHGFREHPRSDVPFFRRGQAGAWEDELAPELARRVQADHGPVMARAGYAITAHGPRDPA
jgi:aryl sulfotransferase